MPAGDTMDQFLFVYGTLRAGAAHPMHRLLQAQALDLGEARFSGRLMDLGHYPAAVPDHTGQWQVVGELYQMLEPAPLLEALDRYEGCADNDPEPREYRREQVRVDTKDGISRLAWVYLYNLPLKSPRWIPSGDYLNRQGSR